MQKYLLWLVVIGLGTIAQVFFKLATRNSLVLDWFKLSSIGPCLLNKYFITGLLLASISFLAWIKILSLSKLSTSFNISALMYIMVALEAYWFLNEPLTLRFCLGTLLIVIGVILSI